MEIAGKEPYLARKNGIVSYVPQSEEIDWSFPVSVREVVAMGRYRGLGITVGCVPPISRRLSTP